jgi:DNA-binding NtrC family response regulator
VQNRFTTAVHEMIDSGIRLDDARQELERLYVERALETCQGSLSRAATLLGVHRNTLTRKLAEHRRAARKYGRVS